MSVSPKITLYTYFRSSCSARLRIALNIKRLSYTSIPVNLLEGEHLTPAYMEINPSSSVPALVIEYGSKSPVTIIQSLSALEYLDEILAESTYPLLPPTSDPEKRAIVRTLANIIVCDVQPVTNLRIRKKVSELGADSTAWSRGLMEEGLRAYEKIVSRTAGGFSVGSHITMADVCLAPAAWAAVGMGVDLKDFPTVKRIVERLDEEEAVKKAHWKAQTDTPEALKD